MKEDIFHKHEGRSVFNFPAGGVCSISQREECVQFPSGWRVFNFPTGGECSIFQREERVQFPSDWRVFNHQREEGVKFPISVRFQSEPSVFIN